VARTFVTKTKLLVNDGRGLGHTLKTFTSELKPLLLVLGSNQGGFLKRHLLGSVSDYLQHHARCPVMIVKNDRRGFVKHRKAHHVAIALDHNVHSDHCVDWFLREANLPKESLMVLLHVIPDAAAKPEARKFLASFKPKCMESQKDWNMKSGLVFFRDKKPSESLIKYCRDYDVDLLVVASKGKQQIARQIKGSMCDYAVHNFEGDVLVFRDWRTKILGAGSLAAVDDVPI